MDINLKDLSTGFDNSTNFNRVRILENKILIYEKENQALKNKIRILQDDNDDKNLTIQEQLSHLSNLENDNNTLKALYDNSKRKFNNETNIFYSTKREQDKEINNMKLLIDQLKYENEKLSNSILMQNKEFNALQQNYVKVASENKLYAQDNTILLSKVKEFEDNLLMNTNNINNTNVDNRLEQKNNTEFILNTNSIYENKLALYSSIINDEINIIAKYIDTYLNLNNYIDDANINIPQLQNISNFPKDNKLSSFTNIINSVEKALKRIINQNRINKNNELALKQEINKINNILEKKNNENIELKKDISDLKRKYFYLKNDYDKINNDLSSQKGFNKQIQNTMNDINNGNDDYIKGLYQSIKNELDKILNEPLFHTYLNLIVEQRNNLNSNSKNNYTASGMKYLFEDILDKYILVNNCIVDDFKKQKNINGGLGGSNIDENGPNVRELEIVIDELNNKLVQKDKIISNSKDEKKLLINQINILQRDIYNLRNKSIINSEKPKDNKLLNFDYGINYDNTDMNNNLNKNYFSVPIFPHKNLIQTKNNLNNNIPNFNNIYNQPYEEENKYDDNLSNNNDMQNFDNNNMINQQYNNINNNFNNVNNINNGEIKDNQNEEEEEENEIYSEGQQYINPPNMQNNNNMNNYGDNNQQYNDYNMNDENDNMNYNDEENQYEQEVDDYKNNDQIQDIIEEEDNENNTLEGDSSKNRNNSNININKNNNIMNNVNYNFEDENNIQNQNEMNLNNNFNSEEEYIHEDNVDNVNNQNKSQKLSNKKANIQDNNENKKKEN